MSKASSWQADGTARAVPATLPAVAPYGHPYSTFVQQVRQYRPADLLPALAAYSSLHQMPGAKRDPRRDPPWAVSAIAKESILHGNEHRRAIVDAGTIPKLLRTFSLTHNDDPTAGGIENLMIPIIYQQFSYQQSTFEELSRTGALMLDTALPSIAGDDVADWHALFGMPLLHAWKAVFVLSVWATNNEGRIDAALLDSPNIQDVIDVVPRQAIEMMAARLTATIPQAKTDYEHQAQVPAPREVYGYNPLVRTPMLDLGGGHVVVPQQAFLLDTITPTGLYYAGLDAWGSTFSTQLGYRVEAYVGRLLDTIDDVEVLPEITYGRSTDKSIDWFIITPEVVVLVECKSQRLPLDARAGGDSLLPELVRRIGKGRSQINKTHAHITARHPAFTAIPVDRPLIGLYVTSDPLYLANSPIVTRHLPPAAIPTLSASLRELEMLVTLPSDELGPTLLRIATDPKFSTWSISNAIRDTPTRRNPLLGAAWDSLASMTRISGLSTPSEP